MLIAKFDESPYILKIYTSLPDSFYSLINSSISFRTDLSNVFLALINPQMGLMLEKGFLRNRPDDKRSHHRIALLVSKTLLYLGTLVLIVSFVYLLIHKDKADTMVGMMFPFLVAGLGLIIVSQFVKRAYSKLRS